MFLAVMCHTHIYIVTIQRPLSDDQLQEIEVIINDMIEADNPVYTSKVPLSHAKKIQGVQSCATKVSRYSVGPLVIDSSCDTHTRVGSVVLPLIEVLIING